jgi:small subunit ribosomal protein S18
MEETKNKKDEGCPFCVSNAKEIDYKNTELLRPMVSNYMKILPPRRTHLCSWHQRKFAQAVKRARIMALLPFTNQ